MKKDGCVLCVRRMKTERGFLKSQRNNMFFLFFEPSFSLISVCHFDSILHMENPYLKTLESYIQFWENFRVNEKVHSMNESLGTISKSQESSVKSRKELASKTKEIRNTPANERMNYMKSLLKLYQDEIDHLTIRSQYSFVFLS